MSGMHPCSSLSGYLPGEWCLAAAYLVVKLPLLSAIVGTVSVVGLILINVRSFPLAWHINVLLPLFIMQCKYRVLSIRHRLLLRPSATRHKTVASRLESVCPVGAHPFDFTLTCKSWASPDDTDWFAHLSNSSYAKTRDTALSNFCIAAWPTFMNVCGRVALGSTHYQFLREIPRWASYEMKLSIGAWDQKWLYLICRFTSRPNRSHKTASSTSSKNADTALPSGLSTPNIHSDSESTGNESNGPAAASLPRDDPGEMLNCFTVSRICFKLGRITVPPAILLACEGFSKPPPTSGSGSEVSYSHASPPPHWVHPHTLRNASESLDVYREFLAGRWRDVPEGDRWWIEPLSGQIEEQRRANLTKLEAIHNGVAGCMNIW